MVKGGALAKHTAYPCSTPRSKPPKLSSCWRVVWSSWARNCQNRARRLLHLGRVRVPFEVICYSDMLAAGTSSVWALVTQSRKAGAQLWCWLAVTGWCSHDSGSWLIWSAMCSQVGWRLKATSAAIMGWCSYILAANCSELRCWLAMSAWCSHILAAEAAHALELALLQFV